MPKYVVVPEIIHHKPIYITTQDRPDPYPINPHFPPDPAISAPVIAYDCRLLDEGMER